jgi:hypothetical protein
MIKTTRKTEIVIETQSVTIFRRRGREFSIICSECQTKLSSFASEQVNGLVALIKSREEILSDLATTSGVRQNESNKIETPNFSKQEGNKND